MDDETPSADSPGSDKSFSFPWPKGKLMSLFMGLNEREISAKDLLRPKRFLRVGSFPNSAQRDLGLGNLLSGRRNSNSPPNVKSSGDVERRTKSTDDLRARGHMAPQDHSEVREVTNPNMPSWEEEKERGQLEPAYLCGRCVDMNVERLSAEDDYEHSLLGYLLDSRFDCKMCKLLLFEIGAKITSWTRDRYRIVVKLNKNVLFHEESDHYDIPSNEIHGGFNFLLAYLVDLRPWEMPEDRKLLSSYRHALKNCDEPEKLESVTCRSRMLICFTDEKDPARDFGIRWIRGIGKRTASAESFDVAVGWLAKCKTMADVPPKDYWYRTLDEETRERRVRSMPSERPTRLAKIKPASKGNAMVRLVGTKVRDFRYADFRYCWGTRRSGDDRTYQTTKATLEEHFNWSHCDSLPATIKVSIFIAERLGIPYIWVDALCIMQDCGEDWSHEAAKMAGIYLGCELALAVSASASADQGCFNERSAPTIQEKEFVAD